MIDPRDLVKIVHGGRPGWTLRYKGKDVAWFGELEISFEADGDTITAKASRPYKLLG